MIAPILAFVLIVVFGPKAGTTYYSCHECRNLREASEQRLIGLTLSSKEKIGDEYPVADGHLHDWWQYGRSFKHGVVGIAGVGAGGNAYQYKDGKRPPDTAEQMVSELEQ